MIVTILRNRGSGGAARLRSSLSEALHVRIGLATSDSHRRTRQSRYMINWGVSRPPRAITQRQLILSNSYEGVANCQDKRETFQKLDESNIRTLDWCVPHEVARALPANEWLEEDGKVVVRHTTTGHGGHGIQIVRRGHAIPNAPLYTRYFRKSAEYRVHVAFNTVILIQQKRKRNGIEQEGNAPLIRTHENGWVFTANDLACDERNYRDSLCNLAIAAANAVGINHGAIDILTKHTPAGESSVVCEINSAPGIEAGRTLEAYTAAFSEEIQLPLHMRG